MLLLTLLTIALVALGVSAALVAIVWWQQERIVFQPPRYAPPAPSDVRRVEYEAEDGQPLHGYLVEPRTMLDDHTRRMGGLVIAFHGNADLAVWQIPWARELARRSGWTVLLAEYRGYGGSTGTPTYETAKRDARAAYAFARERLGLGDGSALALFGHSLGSAVATELATELTAVPAAVPVAGSASAKGEGEVSAKVTPSSHPYLAALLLQSPFTSARDMARIISSRPVHLVWNVISRVHYDTRTRVGSLETPVWVAHGEEDWLVPVRMGSEVLAAARHPGQLLLVSGAGHNDVEDVGGEAYWRWLTGALAAPRLSPATAR